MVTITKLRALLIFNLDTLPGSERIKQDKHFRKVRVSHRNLLTAGNDRRHPTEPTLFHSRKQIRCPYLKWAEICRAFDRKCIADKFALEAQGCKTFTCSFETTRVRLARTVSRNDGEEAFRNLASGESSDANLIPVWKKDSTCFERLSLEGFVLTRAERRLEMKCGYSALLFWLTEKC